MAYQNRVDPFGELVVNPAKGFLMGNRGRLHDDERRIGKARWKTHSWVTCALSFKGRKREIMAPNKYTELFFLDEATALAAGHRPCSECRRERYRAFVEAWRLGNSPDRQKIGVKEIDPVTHADRLSPIRDRQPVDVADLPSGAMVTVDGSRSWLKWRDGFHEWSFDGYGPAIDAPCDRMVAITPASTLQALRCGYEVEPHPTLV